MSTKKPTQSDVVDTAIVLADSFDHRFTPITLDIPRALCPIVNNPMIHYTLEFLISNGIRKIYIFCCAHSELIKEHINKTYWTELPSIEIVFVSREVDSLGDAMRQFEIGEIENDFVLISGDVISNMHLQNAFDKHKEVRKKDKSVLMTSLFKKASPHHRSRAGGDTTIVAIDKSSQQLLHMDNTSNFELYLQKDLFSDSSEIEFRYDLFDCRIDICSADVILLFHDEFDWRDLRQDFVLGILESEVLQYKIQLHVVEDEYAARVRSLNTYAAISRDIIHRWTYPLVPDSNICGFMWDNSSYSYTRPNIYKEDGVLLERSSIVGRGSVIGRDTSIGKKSTIQSSVLGRDCVIGDNVTIINSYLWGANYVLDNCTIENSILCNGVVVKENTNIQRGCLLSFNCIIGPNITLEPETKVTLHNMEEFNDYDAPTESINLGKEGKGYLWLYDEQDPTNSLNFNPHLVRHQIIIPKTEEDELVEPISNQTQRFKRDVNEIVLLGVKEGQDTEKLKLQINAVKYSYDCSWGECCSALMPPMMLAVEGDMRELVNAIEKYKDLMSAYLPTTTDEEELIFAIQEFCESEEGFIWEKQFCAILYQLYEHEVITEEAILAWEREHEDVDEADSKFVVQCADFLNFLRTAEEEEEEEEETEEESEEA